MALIKSGSNGAGNAVDYSERDFQIFTSDEIDLQPWPGSADDQPVRAIYEYWLSCRDGRPLPASTRFDDRRLAHLGWRMRKIDVRPKAIGDFGVITHDQDGCSTIRRFRQIEEFTRDCLTHDVLQCIERRAPLYVVAVYREAEFMFCSREVLLPVTDANLDIGWVYMVMSYDDEAAAALTEDAKRIRVKA